MATTSTSSQLNVRIDAELKEKGSRGLTRAGYTPARAIRRLWTIAAENENEPEVIERLLSGTKSADPSEESGDKQKRLEALRHGWVIVHDGAGEADLHPLSTESELSDEQLREAAAAERLSEYDRFGEETR